MPFTVYHKISELIIKHLRGEITEEERAELNNWIDASPENRALYQQLTTEETLAKEVKDTNGLRSRILNTIYGQVPELAPVIPMYKRKVFRWIAAACIIALVGALAWLYVGVPANDRHQQATITHDVAAPSNTRAVITLADGTKVYLDSAGNGTIAQENNVNVVKNANGEVVYAMSPAEGGNRGTKVPSEAHERSDETGVDKLAYNTLFNPRGSKVISLTLSDGTRVWLNSESSLRYPASFAPNGGTREVEITGEAYFEVKHNSRQPFKVHLPNGSTIEDIGTSFNVNAYPDEADLKTTLIEGSVKLSPAGEPIPPQREGERKRLGVVLKPGEQAILTTDHSPLTIHRPDLDEVLAWKNGRFSYTAAGIKTIMREVARWYDVEVVYENDINEKFYAEVPRNTNVSTLLKMLEITKAVHFRVEGKKIIVTK